MVNVMSNGEKKPVNVISNGKKIVNVRFKKMIILMPNKKQYM
jgi:hypothetical protein